jgi:hypothetical protein
MDTTGSSISVEEHQANTAKMLSRWLPDRALGKISPLPWEEDYYSGSGSAAAAATASFPRLFSWEAAGRAGPHSSSAGEQGPGEQGAGQRAPKSRRTSLDAAGAAAAGVAPAAAPVAPAALPSVWGPHSASSIYSPSASTMGTDDAVAGSEAADESAEPTPSSSRQLFGVRSIYEQQQQRAEPEQQQRAEPEQQQRAEPEQQQQQAAGAAVAMVQEQSWESSQGSQARTPLARGQQQAGEPAEQQQQQLEAATFLQLGGDPAAEAEAGPAAGAEAAAADPEGSGYCAYYPQSTGEPQTEASSYSYYGGVSITPEASGYDYDSSAAAAAASGAATPEASAAGAEPSGQAAGVFAPWAALVASMHSAGFGADPAMQSYLAYFEQYGSYLVSSHPDKEALMAQLAAALPAPPAAAAAAAAAAEHHQASPSCSSADMAVVLEASGMGKAAPDAEGAAAAAEAAEGALLSDEELALYGETLYRAELMEAVFASSGLSVGMLLECL